MSPTQIARERISIRLAVALVVLGLTAILVPVWFALRQGDVDQRQDANAAASADRISALEGALSKANAKLSREGVNPVIPDPPADDSDVVPLPGPPGADGSDGTDGNDGPPGRDGTDGSNGTDGLDGANGTDGQDGAQGPAGPQGEPGPTGPPGPPGEPGQSAYPFTFTFTVSGPLGEQTYTVTCTAAGCTTTS